MEVGLTRQISPPYSPTRQRQYPFPNPSRRTTSLRREGLSSLASVMTGADLIKYFDTLKTNRLPLENLWRLCYQYSHPIRGVQFGAGLDTRPEDVQQQAAIMQANIFDATATDACRILASSLVSGLTPSNSRWFDLSVGGNADQELKAWLDETATTVHTEIHASNFDAPGFEAMLDVVEAGMAALYIEEGEAGESFNFDLWPLHSCFFAASKKGGMVDTAFRYYTLTAQQAVREYGAANVSDKIREANEKTPYERFPFVHAIMPKQFEPGRKPKKRDQLLPVASYHVDYAAKKIVRERGYSEFPLAVPRWLKLPDSVYAQGPMAEALPDARTLNEIERITLANADWQMSGMWGATDDGVLNMKTVKIGPRKVVFMKDKNSFFPLNPPGDIKVSHVEAEKKRASIRRILMADQLEPMAAGPAKTATEIHYRVNLIRQLLGPLFGRLQREYLQLVVFRCAGILLRKGKLGQLPESLRGKTIRLQYVSPLARAQRLEDVAAMDRYEERLLVQAQARPDVLDNYDWDDAARRRGEYLGVPQSLILSHEKVVELRKVREDRQAKALQQQQAMEAAQKGQATGSDGGIPAGMPMIGAPSPAMMGGMGG